MIPKKIKIRDGKTGKELAQTSPGVRIFSIPDTDTLLAMAHAADNDNALAELGKKIIETIHAQDSKPVQYT